MNDLPYKCRWHGVEYIDRCQECAKDPEVRFVEDALESLPDFIDLEYPKGHKERGAATLHITLFLLWFKNAVKETPSA